MCKCKRSGISARYILSKTHVSERAGSTHQIPNVYDTINERAKTTSSKTITLPGSSSCIALFVAVLPPPSTAGSRQPSGGKKPRTALTAKRLIYGSSSKILRLVSLPAAAKTNARRGWTRCGWCRGSANAAIALSCVNIINLYELEVSGDIFRFLYLNKQAGHNSPGANTRTHIVAMWNMRPHWTKGTAETENRKIVNVRVLLGFFVWRVWHFSSPAC